MPEQTSINLTDTSDREKDAIVRLRDIHAQMFEGTIRALGSSNRALLEENTKLQTENAELRKQLLQLGLKSST